MHICIKFEVKLFIFIYYLSIDALALDPYIILYSTIEEIKKGQAYPDINMDDLYKEMLEFHKCDANIENKCLMLQPKYSG